MLTQDLSLQQENKSKTTAFFISLLLYSAMLAILFFLELIYQPKVEDISGDSVNFGLDLVGMGNINTTNKANPSPNNYDVKPSDKKEVEKIKSKPVVKETPPPPVEKIKPVKVKDTPEKLVTTKDEKSPVTVKENTKTDKITKPVIKTPPAPVAKPNPTPPAPPQPKQPERKVDEGSLFGKKGNGVNGTSGTRDGVGGASDGNDKTAGGNKGRPEGTTDAPKFEGRGGKGSGGGSGDGVSLSGFGGWSKRKMNIPQDASNETGKIVFNIMVDDTGNVISIIRASGTTISSNTVINYYKEYIRDNLSKHLIAEGSPPPKANGTITINIEN